MKKNQEENNKKKKIYIYICKNVNNVPIMKKENKSHSKPKVKPVKPIDCLYSSTTANPLWSGGEMSGAPVHQALDKLHSFVHEATLYFLRRNLSDEVERFLTVLRPCGS